MPIYEYLCESCGRITEVIHKVSERGPTTCGECGGDKVARLVSRSAFQLKGGGWYADLYASKKPGAAKDAAANEPAGGKSSATSEKAPAPAKPSGSGEKPS